MKDKYTEGWTNMGETHEMCSTTSQWWRSAKGTRNDGTEGPGRDKVVETLCTPQMIQSLVPVRGTRM